MNDAKRPRSQLLRHAAEGADAPDAAGDREIHCRRLHRPLPVAEHASCSYCFGKEADIRTGDHERFCDFEEGKDPVCFGFPQT